jgi:diacylglycerol kinase (ATP)
MDEPHVAKPGWWRGRLRGFGYAFCGLAICFRTQANARIHAVATVIVVALGVTLKLVAWEWCAVVISIASVWAAECFNTALEGMVDLVSPERRPLAGRIKDLAAGAVLATAIGAAVVGAIIFLPKLVR